MPARLILALVAMAGCLVLMVVLFVVAWRRTLAGVEASGLRYRLRCEACGTEFELAPRAYARSKAQRSRSVTRTEARGVALVRRPRYGYLAKRFVCPACGERHWCEVLNANEAQDVATPIALRCFGAALAALVVIGFALRVVLA